MFLFSNFPQAKHLAAPAAALCSKMMKYRNWVFFTFLSISLVAAGCGSAVDSAPPETVETQQAVAEPAPPAEPVTEPTPEIPDLQTEISDSRFRETASPLGSYDFLNHTYPLPRGWQNPDGSDIRLENGKVAAVSGTVSDDMSEDEKAEARAERRIGMSHVVTKYFDATGDGQDEAIVILKIETAGNAIPQVIYVYTWKDDKPELLWHFRTGDRTDGGLKDIRPENGQLVIELYGQDRYMLGEVETGKIIGDEAQLCCPSHFTRSSYKWNGRHFIRQGDRLTFSMSDPAAPPLKNYGDIVNNPKNQQNKGKRS